jgi:polyhydroxybutyrate depolymerase
MKTERLTVRRCGHLALAGLCVVACLTGVAAGRAWAIPSQPERLDFGGLVRTYGVHVPAGLDHPVGLVVNLHGAGATGADQERDTNYDAVADAHGFIVAYPDGIDFSWADGRGPSQPDRQGIDDVGFITALAGKLVADFGIDPGHVFATGMSAGAFMVNRLACERADVFAAIAPVAGTLGVNVGCVPSRPVAVLETHGTADPVVPFSGGPMVGRGGPSDIVSAPELAARWRQAGGDVVLKQIDGGGHIWPGDAAEASAQFFASHSR